MAVLIVAVVALFFGGLWSAQRLGFDFGLLFGPCGMKQRTGWPCPTCGMTTSVLAFARGRVLSAFYIQPAAAFLCSASVGVAFLALPTAIFGVYYRVLDRLFAEIKIRHLVVGLLVIVAAGWAVTLARTMAART